MKLYMITDVEGVAGVKNWDYSEGQHFAKGRELLLGEIRAAIKGARQAGVQQITVFEGHHGTDLLELENERIQVVQAEKSTWPFGFDASYDALMFIGQHAMAGVENGHLSHTMNGSVKNSWINGKKVGEFGIWAYFAATMHVPTIFTSGDAALSKEASELIPGIETVSVKTGIDKLTAEHLSPATAKKRICAGVRSALKKLRSKKIQLLKVEKNITIKTELHAQRIVKETYKLCDDQSPEISRISDTIFEVSDSDFAKAMNKKKALRIWKTVHPVS